MPYENQSVDIGRLILSRSSIWMRMVPQSAQQDLNSLAVLRLPPLFVSVLVPVLVLVPVSVTA